VGKVVQPMQSVNCHDSRAHGHEHQGPFTRLVGILLVGSNGLTRSSCFGPWSVAGAKPVSTVFGLATGVRPMSFVQFWLQG
jgi:hypothetical protein